MENVVIDRPVRGDLVSLRDVEDDLYGVVIERGGKGTWLRIYVAGWGVFYRFDQQVKKLCGNGLKE